jgi:hypothetical protein
VTVDGTEVYDDGTLMLTVVSLATIIETVFYSIMLTLYGETLRTAVGTGNGVKVVGTAVKEVSTGIWETGVVYIIKISSL